MSCENCTCDKYLKNVAIREKVRYDNAGLFEVSKALVTIKEETDPENGFWRGGIVAAVTSHADVPVIVNIKVDQWYRNLSAELEPGEVKLLELIVDEESESNLPEVGLHLNAEVYAAEAVIRY